MKKIAIICGGNSGEYEISMRSAQVVKKHLDPYKYDGYLIEIRDSEWTYRDDVGNRFPVNKADFSIQLEKEVIHFTGVFNAIHGTPGEDGKIQAYFDMLGIPYTSCGQDTSALTFNKHLCNKFISSYGIHVADSITIFSGDPINEDEIIHHLGLPVFVKPARSGSSVGISKVNAKGDLQPALINALAEDSQVIIESYIKGRELTCGLIKKGKELIVFPVTEIISKKDFFDYEAKYTKSLADEITPADIEQEVEQDIKALSAFLFRQFDCKGFVRFDYILSDDGLYFLEVNTIPGMTEESILPKMAAEYGMNLTELFEIALDNLFE